MKVEVDAIYPGVIQWKRRRKRKEVIQEILNRGIFLSIRNKHDKTEKGSPGIKRITRSDLCKEKIK